MSGSLIDGVMDSLVCHDMSLQNDRTIQETTRHMTMKCHCTSASQPVHTREPHPKTATTPKLSRTTRPRPLYPSASEPKLPHTAPAVKMSTPKPRNMQFPPGIAEPSHTHVKIVNGNFGNERQGHVTSARRLISAIDVKNALISMRLIWGKLQLE